MLALTAISSAQGGCWQGSARTDPRSGRRASRAREDCSGGKPLVALGRLIQAAQPADVARVHEHIAQLRIHRDTAVVGAALLAREDDPTSVLLYGVYGPRL